MQQRAPKFPSFDRKNRHLDRSGTKKKQLHFALLPWEVPFANRIGWWRADSLQLWLVLWFYSACPSYEQTQKDHLEWCSDWRKVIIFSFFAGRIPPRQMELCAVHARALADENRLTRLLHYAIVINHLYRTNGAGYLPRRCGAVMRLYVSWIW